MSETSAAGGGTVTPGWYTDPHDPRQLRWWSGEGWTEHVSAGSGQQQAAEAVPAQAVPAQAAPAQAAQDAPLPSRRALRDPATEASEAAEAALAAQAAAQQAAYASQQAQQQAAAQAQADQQAQALAAQQAAQQAAWDAQQAAAQPVQPVQPQFSAPVAAQQPSAPVPTLPVAPTSFLEQQGYAPLDGSAPAAQGGWSEPAAAQPAQPQPAQPQPAQAQPAQAQPAESQPNAWNQPVQPEQPAQPVQPVQPNAWNQPVLPESAQPNAWSQPAQPTQPEQQGWSAPATDGMDSLFGSAAPEQVAVQNPQSNQWGLTPSDAGAGSRRQADEVRGSGTLWSWLIAISPILAAGAVVYVMLTLKPAFTDWPFEAAVAAPYLLVLLFAVADRSALRQLGHSQPRSPFWALLSAPIYLIVRAGETRREDGSGTALTIVWFVSVVVALGGIVGYGLLTHHALFVGLPT